MRRENVCTVWHRLAGVGGSKTGVALGGGMDDEMKNAPGGAHEHEGETYYFCGKGCRLEFEEDAAGYLSGEKKMEM